MKGKRHTEQQIIEVLKQAQAGTPTKELCRLHGISEQTYYKWKRKYGGLEVSDAKRLKEVTEENRKLKKLVAEQAVDLMVIKELLTKKF
jgi:putative transposase